MAYSSTWISIKNVSNVRAGESGLAAQATVIVGLLLVTKQKRESHIVHNNSFTSEYFFCLIRIRCYL